MLSRRSPSSRSCLRALLVAAALTVAASGASVPGAAARGVAPVPPGFFGVVLDGPLLDPGSLFDREAPVMVANGVRSVRFSMDWDAAQPYRTLAEVPAAQRRSFHVLGGVPTSFAASDRLMLVATRRGFTVLPVIVRAPRWARRTAAAEWSPPRNPAAFGRFAGLLVRRYGPRGSFWREHSRLRRRPIRAWQIWNEPAGGDRVNGASLFWNDPHPFQKLYVAMLRDARRSIRAADPHARIVLAGLFGRSWNSLEAIYRAGGGRLFDAVAIHPYANTPHNVMRILYLVRRVMARHRDARKPLMVTETGWTSSRTVVAGAGDLIQTSPARQARNLTDEFALLAAARTRLRLTGVYWYTWLRQEPGIDSFDYAGLRRIDARGRVWSKPALAAFRRAVWRAAHPRR